MADGYNRFTAGGQYYYQNHSSSHSRNLHHRNGSPINNNSRALFQPTTDTPSPNRSPGTHSPAHHNPYSMYSHNSHRQNHTLLNGAANHSGFQTQITLNNKAYQNQSHGPQNHHVSGQHVHQDHNGLNNHGANYTNHQHTISASTLSNTTPHFTPAHLQNGTSDNSKATNEQWAEQTREYTKLRMTDMPTRLHYHARISPSVSRYPGVSPSATTQRSEESEHGDRRRGIAEAVEEMTWDAMDMSGQGLKGIAPALFKHYPKLRKLYLNWNKLQRVPLQIGNMRFLTILDLSMNDLTYLPPEIGMLTNLKKLSLYDNNLETLPSELGSLYQLDMLGIEGNPMKAEYKDILAEHGTQELIRYLRENAIMTEPPREREWITLNEDATETDTFTVLSWNILCERSGTSSQFGYAPAEALAWQRRRDRILEEMTTKNADIMCLQEVDAENYNEFFRPSLASHDYKAIYMQKSRAQTMSEREAKSVDGCAIFFKNTKFYMLDKAQVMFSREAIARPDMKGEADVYNRVMPRDHIAVVAFLENRLTGSRLIVVNTHLTWEPWHSDIKIVQVAILMDYLSKLAERYAKWEPCKDKEKEVYRFTNEDSLDGSSASAPPRPENAPSMKYDSPTQIPLLVCGDFNSTPSSGVHELITQGALPSAHPELGGHKYGDLTRLGMSHPFALKSAHAAIGELPFTNYTPDFVEVIDWVFYATNAMHVAGLLGEVDADYMRRVPGWPNHHFPSDHLPLMMEFALKERRERKAAVEANFGNGSRKESRG